MNTRKLTSTCLPAVIAFSLLVNLLIASCSKDTQEEIDIITPEEEPEQVDTCAMGNLYLEKNGLVRVDIENPNSSPNGWQTADIFAGYEGEGYLIWTGQDNFNTPGEGTMDFSIQITTPGTYQFVWRSRIGAGDSNTEHNDSWLRIPTAADFYGEKASTGERVYPRGSGQTPNPEGSSKDGWFKVYMNRLGEWFWRSNTNDRDPYNIFVVFDDPGIYDVQISGRSNAHAIDQFVLFTIDKTLSQATAAELSEIICK